MSQKQSELSPQQVCQILISIHSSDGTKQKSNIEQDQQGPQIKKHISRSSMKQSDDFSDYNDSIQDPGKIDEVYKKYSIEEKQPSSKSANSNIKTQQSQQMFSCSRDSFDGLNQSIDQFSLNQSVPIGSIKIYPSPNEISTKKENQGVDINQSYKKKKQQNLYVSDLMKFQQADYLIQSQVKITQLQQKKSQNKQQKKQQNKQEKKQQRAFQLFTRATIDIKPSDSNEIIQKVQVALNYNLQEVLNKSMRMESADLKGIKPSAKKITQQKGIRIIKMSQTIFIKDGDKQMQIDHQLMNQLAQYFLQQGILVPLVDEGVFNSEHLMNFMQQLIQFLKVRRLNLFQKCLEHLNGKHKNLKKNKPQSSIFSYLNFNLFQRKKYSKVQIICNSYLSKLESIRVIEDLTGDKLEEQMSDILNIIGSLQLLLCFQRAEDYCQQKSLNTIEKNIWKDRRQQLIKDRNWWITYYFNTIQL